MAVGSLAFLLPAVLLGTKLATALSWLPSDPDIPLDLPKVNRTCQQISMDGFPRDLFTDERRRQGWIAVHIAVAVYTFGALVVLIEAYVAAALKVLCDRFHIATDPVRNTVDVIGTSLPVVWCNLVSAVFGTGAMGAGIVIGSCGVNSLFTLGFIGLLVGSPVKLSWYPLWRDNVFYFMAVTILLWISRDRTVFWQESVFVVFIYVLYLLFINLDRQLERGVRRIVLMYRGDDAKEIQTKKAEDDDKPSRRISRHQANQEAILEETSFELSEEQGLLRSAHGLGQSSRDGHTSNADARVRSPSCVDGYQSGGCGYSSEPGAYSDAGCLSEPPARDGFSDAPTSDADGLARSGRDYGSMRASRYASHVSRLQRRSKRSKLQGSYYFTLDLDNYVDGPRSPLTPPRWYWYPLWIASLPAVCVFTATVPDCRQPKKRGWYWATLLMGTVWAVLLSFLLVWMSKFIGLAFRIPSSMMGFVFLSLGLSISQMLATYRASLAGKGYKVVYSILGANVFNISIGLGLVWFVECFRHNPYVIPGESFLYVNLCQMVIVLTPLLLQFTSWRLNKALAVLFVLLYGLFIALIVMFEYNIIADMNPEVC